MSEGSNTGIDDERLRSFFDRLVTMETQRRERVEDIKEIYKEAASDGFEVAALKECIKAHFIDQEKAKKLADRHDMAALYASALQLELPV